MATTKPKTAKKSQEELLGFVEELKRQWMATIDALVDPLMIVNADYTISKANRAMAEIANSDVRAILGKKCYEVFAGRKKPCTGCKMRSAADQGKPLMFDLDEARPEQFFEVSSQPIFDKKGRLEGVAQVYRDRTEAKNLSRQLLQNEKLASIGLLAGGIAHEINNPLGGILIFSQMLLRELPPKSPHVKDVEEILAACKRCKAIVESLLDFARQRPVSKQSNNESVDVVEAMKTALRFARVGMHSNRIDVKEQWKLSSFTIMSERNKVIQLFLNLIQNGFQAMPDGGDITLRAYMKSTKGAETAVFEIEDTGVGISANNLKKIFDPFFTTKEPGEGTGLGLAICYGIAEDLGGSIQVESEPNEGTIFRVTLPASVQKLKEGA